MIGRYQRRDLIVDEIEMLAMLLRNEIADIIQDEFAREMNHSVYEEARCCCEGCEMDDPVSCITIVWRRSRKKYGSVTMRKQKNI